jgi:hypothetical protein
VDQKKRAVSESEGKRWAQSKGYMCMYMETSAESGQNVNEMFDAVFKHDELTI